MKSNYISYLAIGALLLVIGFFSYLTFFKGTTPSPQSSSTPITSTTVISGGATVHENATYPVPNYTKPLTFDASIASDVRVALTNQFNATVAAIKKDATDFQAWVNLGTLRKVTGDYDGAKKVWNYTAYLYPGSTVSFDNLGSLYLDFIKDYPKAEANFKQAIAINPHDLNAYQQLFSLYTVYGYKDEKAAAELVASGLKNNPGNVTLLEFKAQLEGTQ